MLSAGGSDVLGDACVDLTGLVGVFDVVTVVDTGDVVVLGQCADGLESFRVASAFVVEEVVLGGDHHGGRDSGEISGVLGVRGRDKAIRAVALERDVGLVEHFAHPRSQHRLRDGCFLVRVAISSTG